jgi:transcriptional regulator with XRE-family HTH domain
MTELDILLRCTKISKPSLCKLLNTSYSSLDQVLKGKRGVPPAWEPILEKLAEEYRIKFDFAELLKEQHLLRKEYKKKCLIEK